MKPPIAETLEEAFERSGEGVELAWAASALAQPVYPDLDYEHYSNRLDDYAEKARRLAAGADEPEARVSAINRLLFEDLGFSGNAVDYYDPRNSFLNEVLERRTGIPISLSVVYMEIARRLDLPIYGVGLPGHFVVKYEKGRRRFFIDPFHDGRMLNRQGCRRLVRQIHGHEVELNELHFAAVDKRHIILRMAANLRDVYLSTRQYRTGIIFQEVILRLGDGNAEDLRVRAWILSELNRRSEAIEDLEKYLELRPESPDSEETREMLLQLKRGQALMN